MSQKSERPITIAISALGGQGGGVLTNWLVSLAEQCGYFAQSTSVPGVAQRTGATIYYLEMFPKASVENEDMPPVMALMPMAGDVDLVVAAELMEAGRAVQRQFVTPNKTVLIASTHRVFSIAEKMAMGDGTGDSETVMKIAEQAAKDFIAFDMEKLAADTGCVISSIMFGSIAGSGILPFDRSHFEEAIRAEGKMVDINLKGFEAGFKAAKASPAHVAENDTDTAPVIITGNASDSAAQDVIDRINALPEPAREFAYAGAQNLLAYQDLDYVAEYLTLLEEFAAQDKAPFDISRELARYLALWMAFDDVIKVADIKTRSKRVETYRKEVRAAEGQIVHMVEFMHPRLEEIVGTLPVGLAKRVEKSSFLTHFFSKFTGPRLSDTTKISSFVMLYFMASLKFMRRKSLRYAMEHAEIKSWLDQVRLSLGRDYDLAVEIIRCQRLIKGYGETHERGMRNFKSIMAQCDGATAEMIVKLRTAALADDEGKTLSEALKSEAA